MVPARRSAGPGCSRLTTRTSKPALEPVEAIFFYGTHLREFAERDAEFGQALMARAANVMLQRLQAAHREVLALRRELAATGAASTTRWNEFRPAN